VGRKENAMTSTTGRASSSIEMDETNLVHPDDGCPRCGERDVDHLVWNDDGATVTCRTCGIEYVPGEIDA